MRKVYINPSISKRKNIFLFENNRYELLGDAWSESELLFSIRIYPFPVVISDDPTLSCSDHPNLLAILN